jgi:hypothetical protein
MSDDTSKPRPQDAAGNVHRTTKFRLYGAHDAPAHVTTPNRHTIERITLS